MYLNLRPIITFLVITAIAVGCGTARRIIGDEQILPAGNEVQVAISGTPAENKVVTFSIPQGQWRASVGSLSYSWNFGGGATPETSNLPQPVVTLVAADGTGDNQYQGQVTLSVWKQNHLEGPKTYNFSYSVMNTAAETPTAIVNGITPGTVVLDEDATFGADVTVTPNDSGWSYVWDLSALDPEFHVQAKTETEGGRSQQVHVRSVAGKGPYEISLLVFRTSTPEIRSAKFKANVTVASSVALDVQAVVPGGAVTGTTQAFSAILVKDPPNTTVDYLWDVAQISDTATQAQITTAAPEFEITAAASTTPYKCKLTVQLHGQPSVSDSIEFSVTVRSAPTFVPSISIDDVFPLHVVSGTAQEFTSAVEMSDGSDDISYAWDVASLGTPSVGSTLTDPSPTIEISAPAGSSACTLYVWQTSNPAVRAHKDFQVQVIAPMASEPPTAAATILELGPGTVYEGKTVTFSAVVNSNTALGTLVYAWDLAALGTADDSSSIHPKVTMASLSTGTYQVSLSVYSPAPNSVLLDSMVRDVTYVEQP